MKVTRRAFLKGIVATGAAAAVPAFIIRREPEPMVDLDVSTVFDEVSDGDPLGFFMPREGGENFSNLFDPSRATTLTRENVRRAIACYENALQVYTPEKYPEKHTEVKRALNALEQP